MRSLTQAVAWSALAVLAGGCTLLVRHSPTMDLVELRQSPPGTVAVLPFYNDSTEPMAAAAARDALYYALADRGFRLLDEAEIDRKLSNPVAAAGLRRAGGGIDAQAAGRLFGADAVALGRVVKAKALDAGVVDWTRFKVQVWLVDTRTQKTLWSDTAYVITSVFDRSRRTGSLTPAEREQAPLLRLFRSFDAALQRVARRLPSVAPEPAVSQVAVRRLIVRSTRPILSAGDRLDIIAEGTAGCTAQATLGTLGKAVALEESGFKGSGIYRGSYTVQPGDKSNYCRVVVTLASGPSQRRQTADARSAVIINASQPDPATGLYYETQPDGILVKWERPISPDVSHYLVYRSETTTGGVMPMARPLANEFDDHTATHAGRYVYFVKAVDHAGNPSSSSAELIVDLPSAGPTTVGGKLEGEVRWTAFGAPYRLSLDVDVTPGARLIIEAGTQIEIPAGMEITVRGRVEATGRPRKPIRLVGDDAARGFHINGSNALLQASYVEILGMQRGIEVSGGEGHLDHVTLRNNPTGLDAGGARRLTLTDSLITDSRYGVVAGSNCEIRTCGFIRNTVGLRAIGDGLILDRCRFDNIRLDIEKVGSKPLSADGNTFWTSDPSELFRHLRGNVTCRSIFVPRWWGGTPRPVQFEPVKNYIARGEAAAVDMQWEKALHSYEAALLQERNRDLIDKALIMYKQLVVSQGPLALQSESEFCQSATMAYPRDTKLLQHLAELYFGQTDARMGREICAQLLRIDPSNEFAKKNLAAAVSNP